MESHYGSKAVPVYGTLGQMVNHFQNTQVGVKTILISVDPQVHVSEQPRVEFVYISIFVLTK